MAEKQTLYQTVLSDTPEMRSLKPRLDRGEARALSFSKEVVGLFGLYSRSLLTMLDRGEARALSFSICKRVFITNVKGTFFGMSESEEASKRR